MNQSSECRFLLVAVILLLAWAPPLHGQIVEWTEAVHDLDGVAVPPLPEDQQAGPFNLVVNPGPTLAGNAPALAAFNRAADQWAAAISDSITVTIDADLADLGSTTIIGQASSVILVAGYASVRSNWLADADADDAILASIPTAAQFLADYPVGFSLNGNLGSNKSALKAIGGFGDLDAQFGVRVCDKISVAT